MTRSPLFKRDEPPAGRRALGRDLVGGYLRRASLAMTIALAFLAAPPALAGTLNITPTFDTSITSAPNAAAIEGAINQAIGTIDGLYTTFSTVTDNVYFTLGSIGSPATTLDGFFAQKYTDYTNALKTDAAANPSNIILKTAIDNLPKGNDAGGAFDIVGTSGHFRSLGFATPPCFNASGGFACGDPSHPFDAIVTLDASKLTFTGTPPAGKFDGRGVIEHQVNEALGGGGAGSTLNQIAAGPCPSGFFCDKLGVLDLYRYSAPDTPSFTTDPAASAYFSVDGGTTPIVGFDQDPAGDYGDWGPNTNTCPDGTQGGPDALIENAFPCSGQLFEAYTSGSPEYPMMLAIGYDPKGVVPPPLSEPGSLAPFALALVTLAALHRRRRADRCQDRRQVDAGARRVPRRP